MDSNTVQIIVMVGGIPSAVVEHKKLDANVWDTDVYIEHPSVAEPVADALADAARAVRFADWKRTNDVAPPWDTSGNGKAPRT